jgi:hypothetical protein
MKLKIGQNIQIRDSLHVSDQFPWVILVKDPTYTGNWADIWLTNNLNGVTGEIIEIMDIIASIDGDVLLHIRVDNNKYRVNELWIGSSGVVRISKIKREILR